MTDKRKIVITSHCFNDSSGEYCIRLEWTDEEGRLQIRLGRYATRRLEEIFRHHDSPVWTITETPYLRGTEEE